MKQIRNAIIPFFITFFLCSITSYSNAQRAYSKDTITMMQYNLMYYTKNSPESCSNSDVYLDNKDINLKKIINYTLPDVFCVNEIGKEQVYVNRILNNVMNSDGRNYYAACPLYAASGGTGGSIGNMLYYDTRKLSYHSHFYVVGTRYINAYKMYYKNTDLAGGDTAFITFIIAHLKAGYNEGDARHTEVANLMNRLSNSPADNYTFSGDFNLYSSNDAAYRELVNYSDQFYAFKDPIDGAWGNMQYTQSTHTSGGECLFSTGGMDDRFDIIFVSPYIYWGAKRVRALPDTYHAFGQDGLRYNGTIINPPNTAVPQEIAQALYNMSDHIPVIMQLEIESTVPIISPKNYPFNFTCYNVSPNQININISTSLSGKYTFEIYAIEGRKLSTSRHFLPTGASNIAVEMPYSAGIYLLRCIDPKGRVVTRKIVIN